jgi:transposase, IS5 family
MYRGKDREGNYLFKELMPFGGQLEKENRWLKIKELIPWRELEGEYARYFSQRGRPGLDGRLVIGLFLLKHMSNKSDREVIWELQENVYWQAFCSFEGFVTSEQLNASSLSKIRQRLGPKFTKELEDKTYGVLIEKKIIKAKGMLVDATVVPEKIKYPNDIGLLNDVREWIVGQIKEISGKTKEKVRTYRRKAKRMYINFSKRKQKTKKMVERAKREMLQYVRRNIRQLEERLEGLDLVTRIGVEKILGRAKQIYEQQYEMYKSKTHHVQGRIVSWWREYVRPIKRGKSGGKETEFGPKVCLSHVDGITFVDKFAHDNYSEGKVEIVEQQIENYKARFGKKPVSLTGDQLYGNRENRQFLKDEEIRDAFKPLGRKTENTRRQEQYLRRKQRERNLIEGDIGNAKEHYGLSGIRYHYVGGSEMWVRLGFLAKNLKIALARVS